MLALKDKLRARRSDLGLSQPRVAQLAGVGQTNISRWEAGTEPPASAIPKLARALQCSSAWLLGEEAAVEVDPRLASAWQRVSPRLRELVIAMVEEFAAQQPATGLVTEAQPPAELPRRRAEDALAAQQHFSPGDRYQIQHPIYGAEDRYRETTIDVIETHDRTGRPEGVLLKGPLKRSGTSPGPHSLQPSSP